MESIGTLEIIQLLAVVAIIAVSGLVHGILGLGFPLVATPLLSLVFDVRSAIVLTLVPTIIVNLLSILRGGNWRDSIGRYWPMAMYAVIGSFAGTYMLLYLDAEPFRLLLAMIILLYLNMGRLSRIRVSWTRQHGQLAMMVFGLIGGVLAGTVNVMVPVLVIFALEAGLTATVMVQVFNFCFLGGKVTQLTLMTGHGLFSAGLFHMALLLGVVSAVALWLGMQLRSRVELETCNAWLRTGLWVMAPLLLIQFIINTDSYGSG